MSWTVVANASNDFSVKASASTSFSTEANVSNTYLSANAANYVEPGYVQDGYVESSAYDWTELGVATNTWASA